MKIIAFRKKLINGFLYLGMLYGLILFASVMAMLHIPVLAPRLIFGYGLAAFTLYGVAQLVVRSCTWVKQVEIDELQRTITIRRPFSVTVLGAAELEGYYTTSWVVSTKNPTSVPGRILQLRNGSRIVLTDATLVDLVEIDPWLERLSVPNLGRSIAPQFYW